MLPMRAVKELSKNRNHQAFWVHDYPQDYVEKSQNTTTNLEGPKTEQGSSTKMNKSQSAVKAAKPTDFFADPNSKMMHVKSYMMVRGKLIPSIKYKAKQPIYNRYKIESEGPNTQADGTKA